MEKELELLRQYLAKTLNLDTEQVAELVKTDDKESIKPDALDLLLAKDVERVDKLKAKGGDSKEAFDNGYKKATAEVISKLEKDAKDLFEITTEAKGLDLITAIVEHKTKGLKDREITADEIKKSAVYLNAIDKTKQESEQKIQQITEQFQGEIAGFKKKEGLVSVLQKADNYIDNELKPIWSKNPATALSQRKQIHGLISRRAYETKEDGRIVPLNGDNQLLEDAHGHPINFNDLIKQDVTSLLDLQVAENRKGAGELEDDPGAGKDGWNWNGQKPKNDEEFISMVQKATSTDEKKAIRDSYEKE